MSLRTVRTVAGRACALLVAGLVVAVLGVTVIIPALAGAQSYTILTGSMEPGMPPGTVVVVRPTPVDQIRAGDVITYQLESGRSTTATHRVVEVQTSLDGSVQLITRGDANDAVDPDPVRPVQVMGVRWYSVPLVGLPALAVDGDIRQLVVQGAVVLLLGYAVVCLAGAARERRRVRTDPTGDAAASSDRPLLEVGS